MLKKPDDLTLDIYQWQSKTETVEEEAEEAPEAKEDGAVEEEKEKKTKKVEKTTWDWSKVNNVVS